MFLSFLKGRRGILIPFSVAFALVIFLSLIGVEWRVALSVATFVSSLAVADGIARALWEDGAVHSLSLIYGSSGVLFFMASVVFSVSLILNLLISITVSMIASIAIFPYAFGILIWTFSSSLLCALMAAMGEVAGVSLSFVSAILQLPLLSGFYSYLSGNDPKVNLGLVFIMGIFYASFMWVFADVLLEE